MFLTHFFFFLGGGVSSNYDLKGYLPKLNEELMICLIP